MRRGLPRSGGTLFRGGGSASRRAPLLRTGGFGPFEGFTSGELFRGRRDVHRQATIRVARLLRQLDLAMVASPTYQRASPVAEGRLGELLDQRLAGFIHSYVAYGPAGVGIDAGHAGEGRTLEIGRAHV